ncbi:MAG TPA: 4-(cytidine 5'-diphospho)-2-C-methyl-D-erythritol kinase [Acidiferrobacteraceae bacterium]|nr:4-(cytidine 5'-diphospho)-2-C-methyl-D-erythritol kinase [Acidiferrobacteraceae bacterium]
MVTLGVRWLAPAKLNLFLRVLGRREDGRHELQTVFQFIGLSDELEFRVTADGKISCASALKGLSPEDNLCVRAARLLRDTLQGDLGAAITLHKRIPIGGGLGGGSSDAATTLHVLNRLWGTGLSVDALASLSLSLGADVPVFVRGWAAWAEGLGERLSPMDLPEPWYVVVAPPVHVSTGEIFQALAEGVSNPEERLTQYGRPLRIRDFLAHGAGNDLEPVARRLHPDVGHALDWLAGFGPAQMTGSGACVYLAVSTEREALAITSQLQENYRGFVCRGLNQSPLMKQLAS